MKKKTPGNIIIGIIRWVAGNTLWDILKRIFVFLCTVIPVEKILFQPSFSEWLGKMNIPVTLGIFGMFVGFFVVGWLILSGLAKIVKVVFPKFFEWAITPDPNNLHLSLGYVYNNSEYTLKFFSREWRHPFSEMHVMADASFDNRKQKGELVWGKLRTTNPIAVGYESLELNFIKVDAKNNVFWIDSRGKNNLDQTKFLPGLYWFIVEIGCWFGDKLPFFPNDEARDSWRKLYKQYIVNVDYKGSSQISIEVKNNNN